MNTFRRGESKLERQAREADKARLETIREEYGRYCRSRFMTVEQALLDFEELIRHPMVQCVDFADIDGYRFFLVGTTHISITTRDGGRYNIGEFILMFHRTRFDEQEMKPTLLLKNVTIPNAITGGARSMAWSDEAGVERFSRFAHPHISGNPGEFCMSTGGIELNQALTEGDVLEALHITLSALQSVGPDPAYYPIHNWPTIST